MHLMTIAGLFTVPAIAALCLACSGRGHHDAADRDD